MKNGLFSAGFVLITAISTLAQPPLKPDRWTSLFNGKDLSGWESYLDRPYQTKTEPLGLNNDPKAVFSVVQSDGKPAIRVSGEIYGGINTLAEFENYHLRLEFKWGQLKWAPKLDKARDSGLLYHNVGPHGTAHLWMESLEFQIQEGDCGDYWGVMNVLADIPARKDEKGRYVYQPDAETVTFKDKTPVGRWCVKSPDAEKPSGEWNVLELYCLGGTCLHVMNGKVNLVVTNARHLVDGREVPLTKGKLQLQSEGAELFYRNIEIRPIQTLPKELLKQ